MKKYLANLTDSCKIQLESREMEVRMKKTICLLLVIVMMSLVFVACDNRGKSSTGIGSADNEGTSTAGEAVSTSCDAEFVGQSDMIKLAEKIQKELPEDVWSGYYLDHTWNNTDLQLTLYIFLLKDYEDLTQYEDVVYKRVAFPQKNMLSYFRSINNIREDLGFYEAAIDYPNYMIVIKAKKDVILDMDYIRRLIPEGAYRIEYIEDGLLQPSDNGITSTILEKLQQELKDKTSGMGVDITCEAPVYDQLVFKYKADWTDGELSSEGKEILQTIKQLVNEHSTDFYAAVAIEVGDISDDGNLLFWAQNENKDNCGDTIVKMELSEVSPTGLTVIFTQDANNKIRDLIYGEPYWLEKKIGDEWVEVPTVVENYVFYSLGYAISHDSPSEKTENWEWLYGKLEPGVYRIGKSMTDDLRMGDARFNKFRITKQFQIFE